MGIAEYLPQKKEGLYGTTIDSEVLWEKEDAIEFFLKAHKSRQLPLPVYVRINVSYEGLTDEQKRDRIEKEVKLALLAIEGSLKSYALKLGIFEESFEGVCGETFMYSFDPDTKVVSLEVLTKSGKTIGTGSSMLDTSEPLWHDVYMAAQQLRRRHQQTMMQQYTKEEYESLASS